MGSDWVAWESDLYALFAVFCKITKTQKGK